ncbi:MAG: AsnC family protein, partial [Lachnospiraceae bacterium]
MDRQIVRILQKNARTPLKVIAESISFVPGCIG